MVKKLLLSTIAAFSLGFAVYSQTYLSEDFESAFTGSPGAPTGWSQTKLYAVSTTVGGSLVPNGSDGPKEWVRNRWGGSSWDSTSSGTAPSGAQSGVGVLYINDYNWHNSSFPSQSARLISPTIDLSTSTSPYIRFYLFQNQAPGTTLNVRVLVSPDGGTTWDVLSPIVSGFTVTNLTWSRITLAIPAAYRSSNFKFAFEATNRWGTNSLYIDNVTVQEFSPTTITSTTSGDWNNASTWVGGVVPTADNHVVIAAGHTVTVTNATSTTGIVARCQNLTVNGILNYGSGTSNLLQVYGNIEVSGTFNAFNGTSGRVVYCGGNFTINAGGLANFSVSTTQHTTATTSITTGMSGIIFTNNQSASFTNNGTLTSNRIGNILHLGQGNFTYNSPVVCTRLFGLYLGNINPNGNLTLGESSVSTTQTIERHLGTLTSDPTFGTGVTRSYSFYTPNWSPLTQQNVNTGREFQTISGVKTVVPGGSLTINTHNNINLSEDLQLGTGTSTAATLTLTRGIIVTGSYKLIWNTTSTTGPSSASLPSTTSPPTTHGSYVAGNFKILFQTSGTASRTVPLGIGTNFNSISAPTANRATPIIFGNTTGWSASNPFPIVSWAGTPSGTTNSPLTTLFTARALRVNLDGGNDFNSTTTISFNANNYTYGGGSSSDNLSAGDISQLRLAQSSSLSGPWDARSTSSGSGSFVSNTNYSRTSATAAPGPIAPLATNGEYFAWASTVPSLDVAAMALVSPPSTGCYGTNQTVSVKFRNASASTIDFSVNPVTVGALVQGATTASPSQVVNTGTLASGDSMTVTVTTTLDMSAYGTYTFTPYAVVTGDGNTANDSLSPKPTRTRSAPASLPTTLLTFTGFTGANLSTVFPQWSEATGLNSPSGTTSSWTSQTGVTGASGTTARVNLYTTTRNEWLVGPKVTATSCTEFSFKAAITDFASATTPDGVGMSGTDDSVTVMISTDCGATWQRIYAITAANGNTPSGTSISWRTYNISLAAYDGQDVIVALKASDGPTDDSPDYDFHVDNLQVKDKSSTDISADAIVVPVPGGSTQNGNPTQQITVRLKNTGCSSINFSSNPTTVTVNVTGPSTASRNVTVSSGTLAPGDTLRVDVGATFAMTTIGTYSFSGFASTTGDGDSANDTFSVATHDVTQGWNVVRQTGVTYSSIMATGTSYTGWGSGTNTDDNLSGTVSLPTGFDFVFYGTTITGFKASTNGFLTLDPSVTTSSFSNSWTLSTVNRVLAPFWDDLRTNGNPSTSASLDTSMKYQILGTAPNRVLVCEWKNFESFSNPNGTNLNFQIRLYETTDSIEFVYGSMQGFDGSTNFTWSYSLGLKGANTTLETFAQQTANSLHFTTANTTNLTEAPECFTKYIFTPLVVCGSCGAPTSSAPSNDNAAGAITIPVNSSPCVDLCGTYYNSRNATLSPQTVCTGNADDDVWFKFTAPNPLEGNIKIDVRGAGGYDPVVEILDASFTSMRCRNATGTGLTDTAVVLESNLTPGATYYARVYHSGSGSGTDGNFSICVYNQPEPPVNDTVAGAIALTIGSSCSPVSGSTLAATSSKNPGCTGTADDDLWYRFTATSPNIVIEVQSGAGFNAALQVFDSISTPLSSGDTIARASLACVNSTSTAGLETFTSSSLVVGRTYYVRVYHQPGGAGSGAFTICAYTPPKVLGTITATQVVGDVAIGASGQAVVGYNLPVSGFLGNLTLTNAVVTSNNTLNSDIAAGGVLLYSTGSTATFTSPTLLGSASFSGSTATFSSLSLDLANGNNYIWIAYNISPTAVDGDSVDAFFAAGSLTISATGGATSPGSQPPTSLNPVGRRRVFAPNPHDECTGAKPLAICASPDTIRNLHRTTQSIPALTCSAFTGTADDDVWYSFVASASTLYLTVYSSYDAVVDVRSGACNGTSIGCADDVFSSGFEDLILTGLTVGNTYYVRVYSYSSTTPASTDYIWAAIGEPGCWLGINSGANNWSNTSNWINLVVPNSCADNVTIPSGTPNQPSISGVDYTAGNVTISGGVTLSITGNKLNVCGNWVGGTSTNANVAGNGRVELRGTGAQSVSGRTAFNTLRVNKTSGSSSLATGAIVDINNFLELEAGNFNVSAGTITFKSPDADNAAMLDNFSTGFSGTITGSIVAERSYNAATDPKLHKQHFFGSPINNVAITQFAPASGVDGGWVTPKPDCDEMWLQSGSNYGNVFEYDESNVTFCHLEAWKVRSAGNAQNGRGYSVVKSGSGKLVLTGPTNTGNYTVTGLTRSGWTSIVTPQGNFYESGWSLLGNPYLASLDLDFAVNSDFENAVQVLHTSGPFAGTYQPVLMSGSGVLAPFQGFMARKAVTGGTATFTFNSSNRSRTTTTFQKNGEHQMSLTVVGNGFSDITYFNFDANSTTGYDYDMDGSKLSSMLGQPTLYSIIGSTWASINTNPNVQSTPSIPVGFNPGNDGTFQITANGFDELPNTTVYLEDKKANVMHNLSALPEYTFTAKKGDLNERFVLHFNYEAPTAVKPIEENGVKVFSFENNVVVDFSNVKIQDEHTVVIYDILGKVISNENFVGKVYTKSLDINEPMYVVVKTNDGNTFVSKKLFVTK